MEGFYPSQLSQEEPQRRRNMLQQQQPQHIRIPHPSDHLDPTASVPHLPHTAHPSSLSGMQLDPAMMGSGSLADIFAAQTQHDFYRRRNSVPHHAFATQQQPQSGLAPDPPERRMSAMDFGTGDGFGGFGGYQFTGNTMQGFPNMAGLPGMAAQMPGFDTQAMMTGYHPMMAAGMMNGMMPNNFANMPVDLNSMNQTTSPVNMFASTAVTGQYNAPLDFNMDLLTVDQLGVGAGSPGDLDGIDRDTNNSSANSIIRNNDLDNNSDNMAVSVSALAAPVATLATSAAGDAAAATAATPTTQVGGEAADDRQPQTSSKAEPVQPRQPPLSSPKSHTSSAYSPSAPTPDPSVPSNDPGAPRSTIASPPSVSKPNDPSPPSVPAQAPGPAVAGPVAPRPSGGAVKSPHTRSGFDCLTALTLVATRKNPEIHIETVDLSCAFVISDVKLPDCPIVYVSPNFQNLTGYPSSEILGKNCRFLQAPDGKVEAGSKRAFVDDSAVYNLKQKIAAGKEVQQSLINYRKGGKPFLNLLTMIPITWDTDEIRYFVGFQIDLVESPEALSSDGDAGSMLIDYKHTDLDPYVWQPPKMGRFGPGTGQTLGEDEVSALLHQVQSKGTLSEWHQHSWDKMLLENSDNIVQVLTIKGNILYASPACKRLLDWDPGELVNRAVADFCHPSDVISVERTLKEAALGTRVNLAWRIRRNGDGGYMWIECCGWLFHEGANPKGRKSVILVGRPRPPVSLSRRSLEEHGGIGDNDVWSKLSTSGMFLYVSMTVRSLLDHHPRDLFGTSIQDMMRKESRPEFGRALEKARWGKIMTCKHEVQHKRGQVLQAHTTLYPGDVPEGQKPTFLIAQTKLAKASSLATFSSSLSLSLSSRALVPAVPPPTTVAAAVAPWNYGNNENQGVAVSSASAVAGGLGAGVGTGVGTEDGTGETAARGNTAGATAIGGAMAEAGPASAPSTAGAVAPGPSASELVRLVTEARDNLFEELSCKRTSSWQFELRQMESKNRRLAEELNGLLSNKKKRKRRKGGGNESKTCANCHTRNTPEWRRGPSGKRDLCNSCGLRWAKQMGRVSPRTSNRGSTESKASRTPTAGRPSKKKTPPDAAGKGGEGDKGDKNIKDDGPGD